MLLRDALKFPKCGRCGLPLVGASTPRGRGPGNRPFPEGSTGYCEHCHIGVTKIDGAWVATPARLSP